MAKKPEAANKVASITTVPVEGPAGATHAIMMALDVRDPVTAKPFVASVAETFAAHRMTSPPDTSATGRTR